jgi:hypothetical protein
MVGWPSSPRRVSTAPSFLVSIRVHHRLRRPLFGLSSPSPALLHRRGVLPPVPWPPRTRVRVARPTWPASGLTEWPHAGVQACGSSPATYPTPTTTSAT